MGGGQSFLSAAINPVGAVARAVGGPAGAIIDPVSTYADKTNNKLLDPSRAFDKPKIETKESVYEQSLAEARQRITAKNKVSLFEEA